MTSEKTPYQSIEEILEDTGAFYFSTLHTDERLDRFFEAAPKEVHFSFAAITKSSQPLIKHSLDSNTVRDGRMATAYTAHGSIVQLPNSNLCTFELDLAAHETSNLPHQRAHITITPDGVMVHDPQRNVTLPMQSQDFIDFSFRAADIPPRQARRTMKLLQAANITDSLEAFYPFWVELAEESEGHVETTHINDYCITQNDTRDFRVRIGRKEQEFPTHSTIDITIEHSRQQFDTGHEIIDRLELSYVSSAHDNMHAERRIFEECVVPELQLSQASFFSNNQKIVSVTELDALDPEILNQFRAVTELTLASTAAHP